MTENGNAAVCDLKGIVNMLRKLTRGGRALDCLRQRYLIYPMPNINMAYGRIRVSVKITDVWLT